MKMRQLKQKIKIKLKFAGMTDVGKNRQNNEDVYVINKNKNLFIVADGMGGHNAGEIASKVAATVVEDFILNRRRENRKSILPLPESLKESIKVADARVLETAGQYPQFRGMGCALIAAVFGRKILHIAHIGDVRGYLVRGNEITQITNDHSVAAELMRGGYITPDEEKTHTMKHVLTKCIGGDVSKYPEGTRDNEPDYNFIRVKPDSFVLFCSDGLTDMLSDEQIKEIILKTHDPEKAVSDLIDAANNAGGRDNITVILINFMTK